jgi:hypothetical protein
MRLADLEPRWFALENGGPRVGLTFDCPHCRQVRLGVSFHRRGREAIDDGYIHARSPSTEHIWALDGADFEDLTLSPSIDASASGHWHGFITNGEVK